MKLSSKRDIVLLVIIFFVIGCTNSAKESLVKNLKNYQNILDVKIEQVAQKGNLYQDSLTTLSKSSKDTFALAKEVAYLRNAKFLLETQYDSVETTISNLNSKMIDVQKATTNFEGLQRDLSVLQSKYKID